MNEIFLPLQQTILHHTLALKLPFILHGWDITRVLYACQLFWARFCGLVSMDAVRHVSIELKFTIQLKLNFDFCIGNLPPDGSGYWTRSIFIV